jgi:hypothetical protein
LEGLGDYIILALLLLAVLYVIYYILNPDGRFAMLVLTLKLYGVQLPY